MQSYGGKMKRVVVRRALVLFVLIAPLIMPSLSASAAPPAYFLVLFGP